MATGGDDHVSRRRPSLAVHELSHLAGTPAGRLLVGVVGAIAALTVIGLLALWPYGWHAEGKGARARSLPATVQSVADRPCAPPDPQRCRVIVVAVEGRRAQLNLTLSRLAPSLSPGDHIRVTRGGRTDVAPQPGQRAHYDFSEVDRRAPLVWIGLLVAALAVALLRWRGLLAIVGVLLSLAIVVGFLIPAILDGRPALLVALVAALAVMFVTLVMTNGVGAQTLAAALGVSATLGLTCVVAVLAVGFTDLGTATDLGLVPLAAQTSGLSLKGITMAGMLVGALGVLADTAVTQASAVMALRRTDPSLGAGRLYREAFVIGRDHLCATIHTLVLAYAGAALPLLLTLRSIGVPDVDVWNNQSIAGPLVATAVGCLALIAAVPLATGLAALLVARLPAHALPDAHHHH